MASQVTSPEMEELLARALCYRWAARLFFYPNEDLQAALRDGSAQKELAAAVAHLKGETPVKEALAALWDALEAGQARDLSLAAKHTYLFARHVLAPPYENRYRPSGSNSLAQDLSEVAGLYAAFGFRVAERAKELPDHLSMELEFMTVLYLKEAYALEQACLSGRQGWPARARFARKARNKFLREHLAWWFPSFEEKLRVYSQLPFYLAAAALVRALLAQEHVGIKEASPEAAPATL